MGTATKSGCFRFSPTCTYYISVPAHLITELALKIQQDLCYAGINSLKLICSHQQFKMLKHIKAIKTAIIILNVNKNLNQNL